MGSILEEPGISAAPTHQPGAELSPSEEVGLPVEPQKLEVQAFPSFLHRLPATQAIELPDSVHSTAADLWSLPSLSIAPTLLQVGPLWSPWLLSSPHCICPMAAPGAFHKVKLAPAACAKVFRSLHCFQDKV